MSLKVLIVGAVVGVVTATAAVAEGALSFLTDPGGVTYGPYVRLESGSGDLAADDGFWHGSNPADPTVYFDLSGGDTSTSGLAFGFDWQDGKRADLSLQRFSPVDTIGPCSSVSDGNPCTGHADITAASVTSSAIMGNLFLSPLEQSGNNARMQPFIVLGLGLASNKVSDWTRENPTKTQPVRSFEGDTTTSLAWSVGAGVSWQMTRTGNYPVMLELAWRYYDLGTAKGSPVPLPGSGTGQPLEPLTFSPNAQALTLNIRVPLKRY